MNMKLEKNGRSKANDVISRIKAFPTTTDSHSGKENEHTLLLEKSSPSSLSRRSAAHRLLQFAAVTVTTTVTATSTKLTSPSPAFAETGQAENLHISAYWKSVDGLNSLDQSKQFVSFDSSAYRAMMDDPARTPFFETAIINRLNSAPGGPQSQTMLDLGTGPFALFAIIAANAGAGRVYAIEANPEAAKSARQTVKKFGFDDVITILEGFSTDITVEEMGGKKADFAVAEIVGSIATEESAYATILDAHTRLVENPTRSDNWIPCRIQTYAAPASYTLHNLFQPPAFDWGKLNGEPVRFNCRDEGLQLLSDAVLVEDIQFADLQPSGVAVPKKQITFTIDGERIDDNTLVFYEELRKARLSKGEAEEMSKVTARGLSGIALWPRLILAEGEGKGKGKGFIEVNSRSYPGGNHQKSHWQTVLPIMCDVPVKVKGGDEVVVNVDFDVTGDVLKPPCYRLEGDVVRK